MAGKQVILTQNWSKWGL